MGTKVQGFAVDVSVLKKKIIAVRDAVNAGFLKPELIDFVRKSLATAARNTPVRDFALIRSNQIQKKGNQFDKWTAQGGSGLNRKQFLAKRAPARYLYRRTWGQVAESLGTTIPQSQGVKNAKSRRDPVKPPPRAYGQVRGGKNRLSVTIHNPLLVEPSKYIKFDPRKIINDALKKHEKNFNSRCRRKLKRLIYAVSNQ